MNIFTRPYNRWLFAKAIPAYKLSPDVGWVTETRIDRRGRAHIQSWPLSEMPIPALLMWESQKQAEWRKGEAQEVLDELIQRTYPAMLKATRLLAERRKAPED